MKTIGTIRRENLERVIKKLKKLEAVAEAAGTTSVYLSQIRNQTADKKSGRPREMGSAMARRIEEAVAVDRGWMDVDHGSESAATALADPPQVRKAQHFASVTVGDAIAVLSSALAKVAPSARAAAVELCATLARAPDSMTVREDLAALLAGTAPSPTWRDCAVELISTSIEQDKQLPPADEIIQLVDALYAARTAEAAAPAVRSAVKVP